MGRELKRIAKDFNWPLGKVWYGYLSPYTHFKCLVCDGSGLNPETKKLGDDWYTYSRTDGKEGWEYHLEQEDVQVLLDNDRLWDFTRIPITEEHQEIVKKRIAEGHNSWLPVSNGYVPTAAEVNEWARDGIGHDSSNRWYCVKARAMRLGIFGHCVLCGGEGQLWHNKDIKEAAEKWERIEPPIGEGYQLWGTCSEGSPISPVFDSIEELCEWAADNATTFADFKVSANEWKTMLADDFVYHKEGSFIFT